jgi:hypothetical protein
MKKERAVSEIIGALLLVILVIAGIAIVGVYLLSAPPQAKEKVVLSSSCVDCTGDSFVVIVRHDGGDQVDPHKLKFWLRTEYANGTPFERFQVYGTWFYTAENLSGISKEQICLGDMGIPYDSSTSMVNGDAVVIWYKMQE